MTSSTSSLNTPSERMRYFFDTIGKDKKIWLLVDEHGSVLLSADDDECVPVWPSEDIARQQATEDWQEMRPEAISIAKWRSRWTTGLEEDDLAVIVFPNIEGEGVILSPDDFDFELEKIVRR